MRSTFRSLDRSGALGSRAQVGSIAALVASFVATPVAGIGSGLFDAIQDRDRSAVERLLAEGADVQVARADGSTALALAVHIQDREAAALLLERGAEVNATDDYGDTPLTLACANGDPDLVRMLLAAGARADAQRWNGETPLMLAAGTGMADAVRLLAERGASLGSVEARRGQSALMWAAAEGHGNVVEALVELGADINAKSRNGFSALLFSVQQDDVRSVRTLLEAGADANAKTVSGSTPANVAAAYGHPQSLALLLESGADFSVPDNAGRTPIYSASKAGDSESVSLLLTEGADPNSVTAALPDLGSNRNLRRPDGEDTPLLAAALGGHLDVMRQLVAAGALTTARTQDGATLLMQAARSAQMPVIEYAFTLDDDVRARTSIGRTVMHAAVILTSFRATQDEICEVIRFLYERGADPDPVDEGGRTAISTADVWPIEKASILLYELTLDAGKEPRILPTDLR